MSSRPKRSNYRTSVARRVHFADTILESKASTSPVRAIDIEKIYVLTYASDSELFHMEAPFGNLGVYRTQEQANEEAHKYLRQELDQQLDNHDPPIRTREQRQEAAHSWKIEESEWVSTLEFETKKLVLRVEEWTVTH